MKNPELLRKFSQTIKALRTERGLSQVEFARALGVTPGAVCNWESAINGPSQKKLRAIAECLNVPLKLLQCEQDAQRVSEDSLFIDAIAIAKTAESEVFGKLRKELKTTLRRAKGLVLQIESMQDSLRLRSKCRPL